jgi:hypothetical protein
MDIAGRTSRTKFGNSALKSLMQAELIEMSVPASPTPPQKGAGAVVAIPGRTNPRAGSLFRFSPYPGGSPDPAPTPRLKEQAFSPPGHHIADVRPPSAPLDGAEEMIEIPIPTNRCS